MSMRALIFGAVFSLAGLSASSTPIASESARWADVHGHPLYYEIRGRGHPLLLLHGGGGNISSSFSQQLGAFSARYTVIAPEQVGQGHSPDISGPISYTNMMEDTVALLTQLNVSDVDIVGWSDGGIIALMLAVNYPQLVHRVVISGANIAPDGLLDSELNSLRESTTGTAEKLRQLWIYTPTINELNVELLQHVNKPVLVLAGDHDVIKIDHTMEIYRALPQAQLSVLPNTGHATFEQHPEIVNPMVLNFLAQN